MSQATSEVGRTVLVIGGGIAGAATADRLSHSGFNVVMIEKKPHIGGFIADMGCKSLGECQNCNICSAIKILKSVVKSSHIRLVASAHLDALESMRGGTSFQARISHCPSFIRRENCIGCGACILYCPHNAIKVATPSIYGGIPVVRPEACVRMGGADCAKCRDACPMSAIDYDADTSGMVLEADAVVVATGFQPALDVGDESLGYGRVPNVITAMDVEQQLTRRRKLVRPTDGVVPARIAFIQCPLPQEALSDPAGRAATVRASGVLQSHPVRLAAKLLQANVQNQATFFYGTDGAADSGLQALAAALPGRVGLRSTVMKRVGALPSDHDRVVVDYVVCEGEPPLSEVFDLVVLAVGMKPSEEAGALADSLRLRRDAAGFFSKRAGAVQSPYPHVYVVGACEGPKDIADTLRQAEETVTQMVSDLKS